MICQNFDHISPIPCSPDEYTDVSDGRVSPKPRSLVAEPGWLWGSRDLATG